MPETDYRTISQQYAQGAINAVILINGGAAIAVLSQLKDLGGQIDRKAIGFALMLYVAGVFVGILTWLSAFMSTRYVDRTLRGEDEDYARANFWMTVGIAGILLSASAFLGGCLWLALDYISWAA